MTLLMRDRETRQLEHNRTLVSQIRDSEMDVYGLSKVLKVSVDYINKVMSLIEDNPELDDEEIAEMLVDLED